MTSETNLREYIISLHQFEDLESFYADMETEGGNLYIPSRAVEVAMRRPISRNTHYFLNEQEAEQIRQDSRVLAVELTPQERGFERAPRWTQTSSLWSKSDTLSSGQLNWGLLRVAKGQQISNWGSSTTTEVTDTVTVPFSGKHVDVVIMDELVEFLHPEFADGAGGSRVKGYNWYELTSQVTGGANGNYPYTPVINYHGTFCAGIAAGITQGWAKDANIYSIYAFNENEPVFDYVTQWHINKPVNPLTGRKNPTILNCSFGWQARPRLDQITSIVYRGNVINGPFTEEQVNLYGIFTADNTTSPVTFSFVYREGTAEIIDIEECIAAGIIVVFAAGNETSKIDVTGGADFNNTVTVGIESFKYNQGSSDQAQGAISVGAISANFVTDTLELKAYYSSSGPGVDVFAPGTNIRSSSISSRIPNVPAATGSSYVVGFSSGTSFAAPQVTGVLATMLEVMPSMTPAAAMSYIISNAKTGQIVDTSGLITDPNALLGAPNRYAFAQYPTTMAIASSTATATPSQTVTYTITMTGAPDGSLVYLTDSGTSSSTDFVDGVRQFVRTITGGAASLSRTVSAGVTGSRTSIMQLRTGGYDGNIQSTASTVTVSASSVVNSNDANLSGLTFSSGALTPAFASSTITYTQSVANTVSSITVTPTVNQANATVTVNGTAVATGVASGSINLNVGANTITTVVTAQDGTTTKTYTTTVTRAAAAVASTDANLSALTISSGTLTPTFNSNTLSYTATVANGVSSVTVTPTRNQPDATITVNGNAVTSGSASSTINLNSGSNTITIVVTAQDGTTTKTYAIIVTASVSDFAFSSGSFTIDAQGKGFFTVTPRLDSAVEGAETFTVSILTGSATGNVVKTSNTITINDA